MRCGQPQVTEVKSIQIIYMHAFKENQQHAEPNPTMSSVWVNPSAVGKFSGGTGP